mmetsp:Transcript_31989/g.92201  ORF Transcript_31989/g.92201 Transcript_31989/m.92201 type:complete len:204 (+) Transcript_31989:653-1264(+)
MIGGRSRRCCKRIVSTCRWSRSSRLLVSSILPKRIRWLLRLLLLSTPRILHRLRRNRSRLLLLGKILSSRGRCRSLILLLLLLLRPPRILDRSWSCLLLLWLFLCPQRTRRCLSWHLLHIPRILGLTRLPLLLHPWILLMTHPVHLALLLASWGPITLLRILLLLLLPTVCIRSALVVSWCRCRSSASKRIKRVAGHGALLSN